MSCFAPNFEIHKKENTIYDVSNRIKIECLFTFNLDNQEVSLCTDRKYFNSDYFHKIDTNFIKINTDLMEILEKKIKEDGYIINKSKINSNIISIPIDVKSIIKAIGDKDNERIRNRHYSLEDNEDKIYFSRIQEISNNYRSKKFAGKIIFLPYSLKLNLEKRRKFPIVYKLIDIKYRYNLFYETYTCIHKDSKFIHKKDSMSLKENLVYIDTIVVIN